MSFDATLHTEESVATLRLAGELDAKSAPRLNELVAEAAVTQPSRLVLVMERLSYLSSAGLRCLVLAHQRMGQAGEIVLVGAQPQVAETIRLTGFDRSVVMQAS